MRLITGNGLVGSALNGNLKISSKDYDLRDNLQVKRMFEKYKPSEVIHTAGS